MRAVNCGGWADLQPADISKAACCVTLMSEMRIDVKGWGGIGNFCDEDFCPVGPYFRELGNK